MLDVESSQELGVGYEEHLISLEVIIQKEVEKERDVFNEDILALILLILSKNSRILSKVDEARITSKIDKFYSNYQKYGDVISGSLPESQYSFYKPRFEATMDSKSNALKSTQLKIINPSIEGSSFYSWVDIHREDMKRKVISNLRVAKTRGLELDEIINTFRGSNPSSISGGVLKTYSNYGTYLMMELTKELSSEIHLRYLKNNTQLFKYFTHISVMDKRTTEICWERNNLRWNLNLQPVGHSLHFASPPLHRRCRSVLSVL